MATALKFRHELKYWINYHQYHLIRSKLKHMLTPDKHAGPDGDYHIRSLYFDDADNTALHEKLGGVRDREKFRIRIYNLSDRVIHLEKKIKRNDYIAKVKESLSRSLCEEMLAGRCEGLYNPAVPLFMETYHQMKFRLLRPKVIVDYVREAYTAEEGNVRITFDKQLKTGLTSTDLFNAELGTVHAFDQPLIVFEVKYDAYLPSYVQTAIQAEGAFRQSSSKYVMCRKLLKFNSWEDQ